MKAMIFDEFRGPLSIRNVPNPIPADHGVVVEVKATGLCRSDWHGWMGHDAAITLPHVPGHELAGIVAEVGKHVTTVSIGDRVTVPFVCGCGSCNQCNSGNHQVCVRQTQPGFTHWGSFAEYVSLDHADTNIVHIPDSISFEVAATLGCRFTTAFRAVVDQAKLRPGETIAIHGCGGVGLSAIMIAHAIGARVIAVDISAEALNMASDLGADTTIHARETDSLIDQIQSVTGGGADVSIDALGSQDTCFHSVACLRPLGKHIQVGLMTGDHAHPTVPMDLVVAHELEIIGSHGMQAYRFPALLAMIEAGTVEPEKLISRKLTIEEGAAALPAMESFSTTGIQVITSF